MQTGEIFTYMLGIFAIILIISTMLYYRYCKKSKSVKLTSHSLPKKLQYFKIFRSELGKNPPFSY
ncbi:unnamed protein product [Brugia pahangi]|uniref:IMV membrane protein n=1 Tax=Brugia pahangi TaxID=6280 RepID=A0A0N4T133_BRUPA|nr:unnamed protein product [Brugia pahangi]